MVAVATRPMLLVTAASAPSSVSGSMRWRDGVALPDVDVVGAEGRLRVGVEHEVELARARRAAPARHSGAGFMPAPGSAAGCAPGGDVLPGSVQEQAKLHHAAASPRHSGCERASESISHSIKFIVDGRLELGQ